MLPSPDPEVPDWWPRIFTSRQRRLRKRILELLADFEATPARGLTAYEVRQRIPRYEGPEIDHALGQLEADGLIAQDVRTVRPARGGPRIESYYRIRREDGIA